MSRQLPAAITTANGLKSIIALAIDWGNSISWYTNIACDAVGTTKGEILNVGTITTTVITTGSSSTGTVNITLDDTHGDIKTRIDNIGDPSVYNRTDFHQVKATLWQYFDGWDWATEKFVLFTGVVSSPIEWSEANRTISFDLVASIEGYEIGRSLESTDYTYIDKELVGKDWPVVFGHCKHVPAVRIITSLKGSSLTQYSIISLSELKEQEDLVKEYIKTIDGYDKLQDEFGRANRWYSVGVYEEDWGDDTNAFIAQAKQQYDETKQKLLDNMRKASDIDNKYKLVSEQLASESPQQYDDIKTYFSDLWDYYCADALMTRVSKLVLESDNIIKCIAQLEERDEPPVDTIDELQTQLTSVNADIVDILTTVADYVGVTDNTNILGLLTALDDFKTSLIEQKQDLLVLAIDEINIEGGYKFPQNEYIEIIVNNMRLGGIFSGNIFTITQKYMPTYVNMALLPRETNEDNVLWVADNTNYMVGQYVLIHHTGGGYCIVQIKKQEGSKCWFTPGIWDQVFTYDWTGYNENDFAYFDRLNYYKFTSGTDTIVETSPIILNDWLELLSSDIPDWALGFDKLEQDDWDLDIGDEIFLATDQTDIYIVNHHPKRSGVLSDDVLDVYAYRRLKNKRTALVPVPYRYYLWDTNYDIDGFSTTVVRFPKPLHTYIGEGWIDDKVYVSINSSLPSNPGEIMSFCINNFTAFQADATSFNTVKSKLTKYPTSFVLTRRTNALKLIQDLAWQTRCSAWIYNDYVFMCYLSGIRTSVMTITEDIILSKFLQLSYTKTEDLVTKLVGEWRESLVQKEDYKVVYRNNIAKYGVKEQKRDIFAFNNEQLVKKTLFFWLLRYSNTWKIVELKLPLEGLKLEPFDIINLQLTNDHIYDTTVNPTGIYCEVISTNYDVQAHEVSVKLWVPIRAGEMSPYVFAFPSTASLNYTYPTVDDIYTGSYEYGS